jgi:hypothetical protein
MTHPNGPNPLKAKPFPLAFRMLQFNAVSHFLCLILLSATGAAAATSAFQLGVNYSEWLSFPANNGAQLATDSSGATYFLTSILQSNVALSTVTKIDPGR